MAVYKEFSVPVLGELIVTGACGELSVVHKGPFFKSGLLTTRVVFQDASDQCLYRICYSHEEESLDMFGGLKGLKCNKVIAKEVVVVEYEDA